MREKRENDDEGRGVWRMDGIGAYIMTSPTSMVGMVGLKQTMCSGDTKHSNKLGMVYIEVL